MVDQDNLQDWGIGSRDCAPCVDGNDGPHSALCVRVCTHPCVCVLLLLVRTQAQVAKFFDPGTMLATSSFARSVELPRPAGHQLGQPYTAEGMKVAQALRLQAMAGGAATGGTGSGSGGGGTAGTARAPARSTGAVAVAASAGGAGGGAGASVVSAPGHMIPVASTTATTATTTRPTSSPRGPLTEPATPSSLAAERGQVDQTVAMGGLMLAITGNHVRKLGGKDVVMYNILVKTTLKAFYPHTRGPGACSFLY